MLEKAGRADPRHLSWWGARVKRGSSCMRASAAANVTSAGGRSSCWPCATTTALASADVDFLALQHPFINGVLPATAMSCLLPTQPGIYRLVLHIGQRCMSACEVTSRPALQLEHCPTPGQHRLSMQGQWCTAQCQVSTGSACWGNGVLRSVRSALAQHAGALILSVLGGAREAAGP